MVKRPHCCFPSGQHNDIRPQPSSNWTYESPFPSPCRPLPAPVHCKLGIHRPDVARTADANLRPKNIILMVADGTGTNTIAATGMYTESSASRFSTAMRGPRPMSRPTRCGQERPREKVRKASPKTQTQSTIPPRTGTRRPSRRRQRAAQTDLPAMAGPSAQPRTPRIRSYPSSPVARRTTTPSMSTAMENP